jgi:hypothetical protein
MASSTLTLGNVLTAEDRLDIEDALARFAAGIDENDPTTLGSVFTTDATLDFGPAARATGIGLRHLPDHPHRRAGARRAVVVNDDAPVGRGCGGPGRRLDERISAGRTDPGS